MTRTIIDISILQTVPPSNINRDDTGSPKTALYGGVRRARVSSQAWKRATRLAFNLKLPPKQRGVRTKQVVERLAKQVQTLDSSIDRERALELARLTVVSLDFKLTKSRKSTAENPLPDESAYLVFLSARQLEQLAEAAVAVNSDTDPAAALRAARLKRKLDTEHSVDIALFGRMVADATDLNVDAAAQVAHAISVHAVETEFDYYTAVDDDKDGSKEDEDAGAAMIGTVEFNSSTLYRYATVDVDRLYDNLGDAAMTRRAVEVFVETFVTSMPTGKQNTFANRTLPDAVVVSIRESQPVNLVGAFEEPVGTPRLATASERLIQHAQAIDASFGTTPVAAWTVLAGAATAPLAELGTPVPLAQLVTELGEAVATRLPEEP